MARTKTKNYEKVQTIKDSTGLVITEKSNFTRQLIPESSFVKIFFEDTEILDSCLTKQGQVLIQLLSLLDYENKITLVHEMKERICVRLRIYKTGTQEASVNSFNVVLSRIVKTGILRRKSSGVYYANPKVFAKGRWADVLQIRNDFKHNKDGQWSESKKNRDIDKTTNKSKLTR